MTYVYTWSVLAWPDQSEKPEPWFHTYILANEGWCRESREAHDETSLWTEPTTWYGKVEDSFVRAKQILVNQCAFDERYNDVELVEPLMLVNVPESWFKEPFIKQSNYIALSRRYWSDPLVIASLHTARMKNKLELEIAYRKQVKEV